LAPETTPELEEYRKKRDFGATPEPAPEAAPAGAEDRPRFVVQRHDARALHFDLRLEVDGVLQSWAVPKGPPLREGPKRLAVRTEDHPLEYLTFEAVIPEGQYGAGRMTVWDAGTYEAEKRAEDELKLVLEGGILRGNYHLVRTAGRGGKEEWLIFRSSSGPPGTPDPTPRFRELRPMLAGSRQEPFDDPAWAFELKWDGYRALALVTSDATELRSRTGKDLTGAYAELADLRRAVTLQEVVLDGEVVVLDEEGTPDFNALQRGRGPFTYVAFDLLHADGEWLLERPWRERRARLAEAVAPEGSPRLIVSDHVDERGTALFALAAGKGLEGIVAKRADSDYRPGQRVKEWLKVKSRPEMVATIGGFTEGTGSQRGTLGALLVGEPAEGGGLTYLSHVGSGFSHDLARRLWDRLRTMEVAESPFSNEVPRGSPAPRWVRPELRAEVSYAERTPDNRLRAPVFGGLVDDPGEGPDVPPGPFGGERGDRALEDGGRRITLTNLDKPYWPREGITKGHLLDHYLRMAPVLVPHVAGRPQILKRYPDGIDGEFFFQHNVGDQAPTWMRTAKLSRSGRSDEKVSHYAIVDDPLGLLWLVNLGCIELNPWQSLADAPDQPTHVLFDLDPADDLPFERVVETALLVRDSLEAVGLRGYPRTSGASGMHVLVPIEPGPDWDAVRLFAQVVSEALVRAHPKLVTTERVVAKRGPRVYLDAGQNGRGRSIASVYSVRPRPGAPVATPLRWEEVEPGLDPRELTMGAVARRVERDGDLAAGLLTDLQPLAAAVARLGDG
jgi:bifunctional non-homologous end joining protein LigD